MDAAIGHKLVETGNSAWRGWTVNPPDKMEMMKWIKGVMSFTLFYHASVHQFGQIPLFS